ncbi:MAG: DNA repair protein RecN [Rhodospirillaceae bacterium]|mgnify:CR=1 FL=1|jgi:DNA repair protein RecN (Recombination protein N)|nr:DNA repair protein RecN [Rhodospirillaceae bacterium]MBT4589484.1 DNA repair protein RecN [Rhodospirillaceae bacterium]MBT5940882.1 DNA repair protein RecN [Rhodospirillaceae bacterium]MBT7268246.1 DNA repair protein RecN [Rhodospirillaceae bacterium]
MLRTLSIRNVVLIERLDLGFGGGLGVLTGETGSGKSILLDALGLAIGVRADSDLIRQGADQSAVTAEFELSESSEIDALLTEHGIEGASNLVLRRVVSADGRSRAFINDQAVSVALLRQIGEILVEVHGQLETHGLLDPATHRRFVDAFGGYQNMLQAVSDKYKEWRAAVSAFEKASANVEKAKRDEEYLRHAVDELQAIDPKEDEEDELAGKRSVLMNAEQLIEALQEAFVDINEGNGVESGLRSALQKVERVADKAGGQFDNAVSSLERALLEATEGIAELERVSNMMELDPQELERIEERLFALRGLARKHNTDVEKLPALLAEMVEQLAVLTDRAGNLEALAKKVEKMKADYVAAAGKLSTARKKTADRLDKAVTKELPPLKLEAASFHTRLDDLDENDWNEFGVEYVSFEVKTNPNTAAGPIHKVASGGELARIMLALKVVLADADAVPTIIFDEVDAGIGGAAAAAVGVRLGRLAEDVQVLVVTHSPQVAARGNTHFQISKTGDKDGNITQVGELTGEVRTEEIARMLSGAEITEEARAAAVSLLNTNEQVEAAQ